MAFAAENPTPSRAMEAAHLILGAAANNRKKQSYWYCLAIQSFVKQLLLGGSRPVLVLLIVYALCRWSLRRKSQEV